MEVPHSSRGRTQALRLLSIGIALLSLILAITLYETARSRERLYADREKSLRLLATALGEYTERTFLRVDILLQNIAEDLTGVDLQTQQGQDQAADLLRRRNNDFPEVNLINLLDGRGELLATSIPSAPPRLTYQDREYFQATQAHGRKGKTLITPAIFGRKAQRWSIPVTLPRYDKHGQFSGLIYAGVDIEKVIAYYRSTLPSPGDAAALYLRDGHLLARHPSVEKALTQSFAESPLFTAHYPASTQGVFHDISQIDGAKRLVAYRALNAYPLLISVSSDEQHLENFWQEQLWLPLLTSGICLLCIGGLIIAVKRQWHSQQTLQARLAWQASHDPVTALPNRYLFEDRLNKAVQQANRKQESLAILFIDLDNFKRVNDSLGHAAGDEVLRTAAVWLRSSVRASDTVARFGGDEFAVLLPELQNEEDAAKIASKILQQFNTPMPIANRELRVTTSIGISRFPHDGRTAAQILASADAAMYRAKECGRNQVSPFDRGLAERIRERLDIEACLPLALDKGEFELAFLPITDARDGRLLAAEALLRWQSPSLGTLLPERFWAIAENIGLSASIGDWIIDEACRSASRWPCIDGQAIGVAINLSGRQLVQDSLPQTLEASLQRHALPAERLTLDLAENLQLNPESEPGRRIALLRQRGIQIAIDDFGTSYAALSYLTRHTINMVKIDKSFVAKLEGSGHERALAQAIITLAHGLQIKTIGEGVETTQQQAILQAMGCDYLQGHLFGRALAAPVFHEWLCIQNGAKAP